MSWIVLIGLLFIDDSAKPKPSFRERIGSELLMQIEQLEVDYGFDLVLDQARFPKQGIFSYGIRGKETTPSALQEYLPMFIAEWRLYPASLVRKTGLKKVVLGREFTLRGERRNRYAIPDYHYDAMFYDVRNSFGIATWKAYVLSVVHHEFFHFIDHKDDGIVYGDDEWKKLNPPEFKYGKGGSTVQSDASQGLITNQYRGFLSLYSQSGVEEDKAEVFRCLMVNLRETEARAEDDPVLARKIELMKALLFRFCPEMDEAYWQRLREMERPRLTIAPYHDA